MSERKVLNKYFPPDFDPSKIPRRKMAKDAQQVVRLMAPCTMCCLTCGEFIYKGKKFNAKKELAQGEDYYGIKIFRFYIKCTRCSAEITFKTDPKKADYVVEHGATRNYEPWQEEIPNAAADDEDANDDDEEDAMTMLEKSQAASKRQMEEEDNLADLRQRNARIARAEIDNDAIIEQQHQQQSKEEAERLQREQEEEDKAVQQYFYKVKKPAGQNASSKGAPNGKGKEKATDGPAAPLGGLGGYGSDADSDGSDSADGEEPATVTVKRNIIADSQPTVQDLLARKGIVLGSMSTAAPASTSALGAKKPGLVVGGVKRKDLASTLGIKIAKKKKV